MWPCGYLHARWHGPQEVGSCCCLFLSGLDSGAELLGMKQSTWPGKIETNEIIQIGCNKRKCSEVLTGHASKLQMT